ncbi:MAG TPA: hypothetical protein VKI44_11075, partial [Acetobacteraceae bacterium]|nr:hypothetical protein [Acetobacteraceae bacterium]
SPSPMQDSLPAGGLRLYREGVEPSGSLRKVSGYVSILLSRTSPVARTICSEFAMPDQVPASVSYRFHARDLHLILTPSSPDHAIRFRVTLDGAPPGNSHGSDVDAQGLGTVQDARLYQLIRQAGPIVDRTFRIEFFDPGVRAYDFTFG